MISCLMLFVVTGFGQNSVPVIDTVYVQQAEGSMNVDIYYKIIDPEFDNLVILLLVSEDGGITFDVPAKTFDGDFGLGIEPGDNKHITWYAGLDYPERFGTNFRVKLIASDARIDTLETANQGSFLMGEGTGIDDPIHEVILDSYGICPHAVSNEEYKLFCDDTDHNTPEEGVANKAPEGYFLNYKYHPVVGVSWYDAVLYCNWLSVLAGLEPCYNTSNWTCDFSKNGYHLPTEAQWEKASRGTLEQKPYPWGEGDPDNRANYIGYVGFLEKVDFDQGNGPTPVDSLNANGYGLYNMAGNVWEWCDDWYQEDYYNQFPSPTENPPGPISGDSKVLRGGAWNTADVNLHCAVRYSKLPDTKRYDIGFRIAR